MNQPQGHQPGWHIPSSKASHMAHITPIRPRVTDIQGKEVWVHPWSAESSNPLVQLYIPALQHQSLHLEPEQAKLLLAQLTNAIEELEPASALLEVSA